MTSDAVRAAIGRIGRTEDVQFSPCGDRLVLVGHDANRLLFFDIRIELEAQPPRVVINDFLELTSDSFRLPHGLCWLDERTFVVANRNGDIGFYELPTRRPSSRSIRVEPAASFGADRIDLVATPGSISVHPIGLGLIELLVCNNYVHHVSRHLIDLRDRYHVVASESLIAAGLHVPGGVAHSPSGRWIAVSNHAEHCISVYRNDSRLNDRSEPQAVLRGLIYPHGLTFADEDNMLVADAGAPLVRSYRVEGGNWQGEIEPHRSLRVMSDETFRLGRITPHEGGPKGLHVSPDRRLMASTREQDNLIFFDLRSELGTSVGEPPLDGPEEAERARDFLLNYLGAARSDVEQATLAIRRTSEREIQHLLNSRWWRITGPFRRMSANIQKAAQRRRHQWRR